MEGERQGGDVTEVMEGEEAEYILHKSVQKLYNNIFHNIYFNIYKIMKTRNVIQQLL